MTCANAGSSSGRTRLGGTGGASSVGRLAGARPEPAPAAAGDGPAAALPRRAGRPSSPVRTPPPAATSAGTRFGGGTGFLRRARPPARSRSSPRRARTAAAWRVALEVDRHAERPSPPSGPARPASTSGSSRRISRSAVSIFSTASPPRERHRPAMRADTAALPALRCNAARAAVRGSGAGAGAASRARRRPSTSRSRGAGSGSWLPAVIRHSVRGSVAGRSRSAGMRGGTGTCPIRQASVPREGVPPVVQPGPARRDAALRHAPPRRTTMPQYLSPGVYVEEVDSGSRPIEGVGTAVAAFVGLAHARPVQHPDPGQQLDAVRVHVRRVRAGLLPGPRRLRLLHERRRQLLRRPDRRRRQRSVRRPRRDRGRRAAGGPGQPAAGRRDRRRPARRASSRSRSPPRAARRRPTTCSSWSSSAAARSSRSSTG